MYKCNYILRDSSYLIGNLLKYKYKWKSYFSSRRKRHPCMEAYPCFKKAVAHRCSPIFFSFFRQNAGSSWAYLFKSQLHFQLIFRLPRASSYPFPRPRVVYSLRPPAHVCCNLYKSFRYSCAVDFSVCACKWSNPLRVPTLKYIARSPPKLRISWRTTSGLINMGRTCENWILTDDASFLEFVSLPLLLPLPRKWLFLRNNKSNKK